MALYLSIAKTIKVTILMNNKYIINSLFRTKNSIKANEIASFRSPVKKKYYYDLYHEYTYDKHS